MLWVKLKRWTLLALGCALFIYLLVHLGVARILGLIVEIGWSFVWIAATYGAFELVRAFASWKCVPGNRLFSFWDMMKFQLSGDAVQFLTSTGPFLAGPAKIWLMQRQGLSATRAVAATVSEYLLYTFTSAVFGIAALVYFLRNYQVSSGLSISARVLIGVMSAFLLAAACAILFRLYLIGAILTWIRKLPLLGKHLPFQENDIRETEDLLLSVLRDRPTLLLSILLVEFAAQALLVLELYILLRATREFASVLDPLVIEGATKFIGLVFFFIPGQLGAAEGVYALVFQAMGLPASAGFALALARRLRSLLFTGIAMVLTPLRADTPLKNMG